MIPWKLIIGLAAVALLAWVLADSLQMAATMT